jgi:hypothetical protein
VRIFGGRCEPRANGPICAPGCAFAVIWAINTFWVSDHGVAVFSEIQRTI